MEDGVGLRQAQKGDEARFFRYYHSRTGLAVKIAVSVSVGEVAMFVNTFNSSTDTLRDKMPRTK